MACAGWLALSWFAAVDASPPPASTLDERVDAVTQAAGYESGHWGILVVDLATGKPIFQRNPDQMFCPASVAKLFSSAAALSDLGPDYRFRTPVVRRGEVGKDGTLRGDLILVAKGDPSLGGRTGPDGSLLFEDNDHSYAASNPDAALVSTDPLAGLDHLAREVSASGIKVVTGHILVDDRYFDAAPSSGSGPSRVSPIMINDNVVDILVTPGAKVGEPAWVRIVPETSFVQYDARVETVAADGQAAIAVEVVGPRRFSIRGRVPVGHRPVLRTYEVDEPAAFARALFIETLRKRGVVVDASPLAENQAWRLPTQVDVSTLPKVAEYTSPPFREYLKVLLKVSQNLHASALPLLVAANHGQTDLASGLRRESELLAKLGVDVKTISFGGGAGGARADLVTPRATVALLRSMSTRPDFPAYDAALPVLGRDGTLARAVASDSPARGHARGKTGTFWVDNGLSGHSILVSKSLAGYLETASGQKLAFAFFVNNLPIDLIGGPISEASGAAGRRLGKLCEVFYDEEPMPVANPARPAEAPPGGR
ncbi:D-alanyl-D-alanine carboxypeptidase/D-alanyl-D-alanine endopeptidase [Tundrisphaera sp. TA3]|uniref:D-alanyl-D-alanine carboxypeptidase/D-alanyl-D-alanine endopeptidase n=1 Tax=Tundrisphaera sp. TA3 TaxID=3435775 RepID=UPI003EBBB0B3